MRTGSKTDEVNLDPPGTRTLWADRTGDWLVALAKYPPGEGLGWHWHEFSSFHLTLAGTSDEHYWKFNRGKLAGTAQYYGAGVEHKTRFGPNGALVLHAIRPGGEVVHVDPLAEPNPKPMLRIMREIMTGDEASLAAIESWCLEMESSIAGNEMAETAWPDWLLRVRQRLFDDPAEGLTVRDVAEDENLNPSHLARTFRQRLGVTVGEYLRIRRLQIAANALLTTDQPIVSIAVDAGFCDQSHFGREFAARYGSTPALVRKELKSGLKSLITPEP